MAFAVLPFLLVTCTMAQASGGGGTSTATPTTAPSPTFIGSVRWIDHDLRDVLIGRNWHPGCPVPIRDLRLVTVSYWTFGGRVKQGPLIINETVADDVLSVFRRLFDARFPIQKIALAAKWRPPRPSDWFSTMNVSASFSCRPVTGQTNGFSQHAYGWAIDINPTQNPYVTSDGHVLRKACLRYVDRTQRLQGMIHPGDAVVRAFTEIGWGWGGEWHSLKDYMHFSLTGT
jgi:hypothetical protein